jgi:hypothetical protein
MLPRSFHRIHPIPKACVILRNKLLFFCTEELLALRSTPKLEDRHLSSVHDCLCNIFAATFDINTTLYIYMLLGVVYVEAYELMVYRPNGRLYRRSSAAQDNKAHRRGGGGGGEQSASG